MFMYLFCIYHSSNDIFFSNRFVEVLGACGVLAFRFLSASSNDAVKLLLTGWAIDDMRP